MDFKAILDVVSKAAPLLGSALGGPVGGLVGTLIAHTFGADATNTQDMLAKIQADPDATIKLKQLELEHDTELRQCQSVDIKSTLADDADARDRDVKLQLAGKTDYMLPVLGSASVILFAIVMLIVLFTKMDSSDHDILYMMIGQLVSIVLMVYGFYFGNSLIKNISQR